MVNESAKSRWIEHGGEIAKFGRILVIAAPIAGFLYNHETATQDALWSIKSEITQQTQKLENSDLIREDHFKELRENMDAKFVITTQAQDTINQRVTTLEAHRDADNKSITDLSAQFTGLKVQLDGISVTMNEVRGFIIHQGRK